MRTLVIHPDDRSTDFLRPIYQNIKGATLFTQDKSEGEVREAIEEHDQILMMGHGSGAGLFNVSRLGIGGMAIDSSHVNLLKDKRCIFIWCNADRFVKRYSLKGLYTGMFISEVIEAAYCGLKEQDQQTIDQSNDFFASLLSGLLGEGLADYKLVFEEVKEAYGKLAAVNEVASYNHQRWYING